MVPSPSDDSDADLPADRGSGHDSGSDSDPEHDPVGGPTRHSSGGSDEPPSAAGAFGRHVSRVVDRLEALLPFALVPLAFSLLNVENVRRTLDPGGATINLAFEFPSPLIHLWSLADPPPPAPDPIQVGEAGPGTTGGDPFDATRPGAGGQPAGSEHTLEVPLYGDVPLEAIGPELAGWLGLVLAGSIVLYAVVAAGYLGGIDRRLRDERGSILESVVRYTPSLLGYYALLFTAFAVALVPALVAGLAGLVVVFPLFLLVGYLFYAAPFLIVVDDATLLESLRRSSEFAVGGGAYLAFAVWHVLFAVVASVPLSFVVSLGGVVGLAIAAPVAAAVGLLLTAATVSLVQELVAWEAGGSSRSSPDPI